MEEQTPTSMWCVLKEFVVVLVHRLLSGCHALKELLLDRRIGCVEGRLLVHSINHLVKTPIGRGIEAALDPDPVD